MSHDRIQTAFGEAEVVFGFYANGALAVALIAADTGEPIGKLSVNLVDEVHTLSPKEFFAKVWSENEGIAKDALASGLFEDTGRRVPTGHVEAQVWRVVGDTPD